MDHYHHFSKICGSYRFRKAKTLLIKSDELQKALMIASPYRTQVAVFRRDGKIIERVNVTRVRHHPKNIAISRDGSFAAVTNLDNDLITIIRDPGLLSPMGSQSSRIELVKRVQRFLAEKGYDVSVVDGFEGRETRRALIKYQRDHGLKPDGIIGAETLRRMEINVEGH